MILIHQLPQYGRLSIAHNSDIVPSIWVVIEEAPATYKWPPMLQWWWRQFGSDWTWYQRWWWWYWSPDRLIPGHWHPLRQSHHCCHQASSVRKPAKIPASETAKKSVSPSIVVPNVKTVSICKHAFTHCASLWLLCAGYWAKCVYLFMFSCW